MFEQSLFAATSDIFKPITQATEAAELKRRQSSEQNSAKLLKQLDTQNEQVAKAIELLAPGGPGPVDTSLVSDPRVVKTVSDDTLKAFLSSTENRDTLFGLVKSSEHQSDTFKFGVMDLFEDRGLLVAPHEIEIAQNVDGEWVVIARRGGEREELPLTESLLALLTKDTQSIDRNANSQYMRLLKLCIGPELKTLVYERGRGRPSASERQVLAEFKTIRKFNELISISKFVSTGQGYRDMARERIIIPPDASSQLHRVFVLLGSKLAGSSADDLKEYSALLEQLLREKKISKQLFKVLYYKYKQST
jgi:hypothetical protein